MSFTYQHKPYARYADGGQPLFFRQRYGGHPQPPQQGMIHGIPVTILDAAPAEAIYIYGYAIASTYEEDREQEDFAWNQRNSFLAMCFSVMEPNGEMGFVRLQDCETISQNDFEAVAARNWVSADE
jgi:hypothetical protein